MGVTLLSPPADLEAAVERFNAPCPLRQIPQRAREAAFHNWENISFYDRAVVQARYILEDAWQEALAFMRSVDGESLTVVSVQANEVMYSLERTFYDLSSEGTPGTAVISVRLDSLHPSVLEPVIGECDSSFSAVDNEDPSSVEAAWARGQIYRLRAPNPFLSRPAPSYSPPIVSRSRLEGNQMRTERVRSDACLECFNHGLAMVNGICSMCSRTPRWWERTFWRAYSLDTLWYWREAGGYAPGRARYSDDIVSHVPLPRFRSVGAEGYSSDPCSCIDKKFEFESRRPS